MKQKNSDYFTNEKRNQSILNQWRKPGPPPQGSYRIVHDSAHHRPAELNTTGFRMIGNANYKFLLVLTIATLMTGKK